MIFRSHPRTCCGLLWSIALCIGLGCVVQTVWAEKAKQKVAAPPVSPDGKDIPDATIPLEPLGYQAAPTHLLLMNVVTSSLHYVDAHHLLLTFRARMLIPRGTDDAEGGDSGQMIAAVLLEAPSGKVLARTRWRMYDHGQYLWSLGKGTFLLRKGHELSLLMPLAAGGEKDPLRTTPFATLPGQASGILVSPDGRMAVVESDVVTRHETATSASVSSYPATPVAGRAATEQHSTEVQFWQFNLDDAARGRVSMNLAGHDTVPSPLGFPLSGDGHLHVNMIAPGDWNLSFTTWRGRSTLLGDVVSTCPPVGTFLSSRELMVVTCDGGDGNRAMTVVTLDKHELWQDKISYESMEPGIQTAVDSGRFASSSILRTGSGESTALLDILPEDSVTGQRIEVRDIKSGMLVASVDAAPVQRAAQNFSLSPDGLHLAVMQHDVIAIYDLAPIKDFPAVQIKPKDLIFVAAQESLPAATKAADAAVAAEPAVIEAPLNVDERHAPPTLYTPEEQAERDRKAAAKKDKK